MTQAKDEFDVGRFLKGIVEISDNDGNLKCYRGQKNEKWPKIPALLRDQNEHLMLNERRAIRELITTRPSEFYNDLTMFDRLVRMQHFGMPTRLLDVSRNPLVALYFATEPSHSDEETSGSVTCFSVPEAREKFYDSDTISCLSNLSNLTVDEKTYLATAMSEVLALPHNEAIAAFNSFPVAGKMLHFIKEEKSYFDPRLDPGDLLFPQYVHAKLNNPRILAQHGGFIMYGVQFTGHLQYHHQISERDVIIPASAKAGLRSELELLGITESILFPELERTAQLIKEKYSMSSRRN